MSTFLFATRAISWSIVGGRLKTKENFKLLALKVVAVAHSRDGRLQKPGSKCCDLAWKLWYLVNLGKLFAEKRWS